MNIALHEIDLMHMGVPGAISAWLVSASGGHVLIESGPASTLESLRAGLERRGLEVADLSAVLLTHIHLDHAGGAWALAQQGVPVHVHHLGVAHLVDPTRLNRSSRRIFQDRFETLWGELQPCPEHRVRGAHDGDVIEAAGLRFQAVETQGHADHHHAWHVLDHPEVCFAGDAAAMRLPGTRWVSLPMPPPELDVEVWAATINRLEAGPWTRLALTHCGMVEDIPEHLAQLRAAMEQQVDWIRGSVDMPRPERRAAYAELLRASARAADVPDGLFDTHVSRGLLDMNLTGVDRAFQTAK